MTVRKKITLRVHGLQHQKDAVDARVFAAKLSSLVRGLKRADKITNGRNCFAFMLADLRMGSATACIREQQANVKYPPQGSSIHELYEVFGAVYNGKVRELNGSKSLVSSIQNVAAGVTKSFSHLELFIDDEEENALRVDEFFLRQANAVAAEIAATDSVAIPARYKGISFSAFDGALKLVDVRGAVKEAKLTLTAGGAEIDCICNQIAVPELGDSLDKRSVVEGVAHYDGASLLPVRLDIKKIKQTKAIADLKRWGGAFSIPQDGEEW